MKRLWFLIGFLVALPLFANAVPCGDQFHPAWTLTQVLPNGNEGGLCSGGTFDWYVVTRTCGGSTGVKSLFSRYTNEAGNVVHPFVEIYGGPGHGGVCPPSTYCVDWNTVDQCYARQTVILGGGDSDLCINNGRCGDPDCVYSCD